MYSFLPDELLKEILAPALQVPDESFACCNGRSPFSNYTPTTSGYLLVCKDWLRVATPLLYSVVVLRSKAQIQALEHSIKSTPILGSFIKKLRIESGYCNSLSLILKHSASQLTDLCLSLEVYSADVVAGICSAFEGMRPRRLIIYDLPVRFGRRRSSNQKRDAFIEAVKEYIAKWEKLTTVILPWCEDWHYGFPDFIEDIIQSGTIETVSIGAHPWYYDWMGELCQSESIKQIVIRGRGSQKNLHSSITQAIRGNPKLGKLLQWTGDFLESEDSDPFSSSSYSSSSSSLEASSPSPSSPSLVKRDWIADLPDNVWSNIILYAMSIPEIETLDSARLSQFLTPSPCRRWLVLICKKFHKLALPLYYRSMVISTADEVQSLNIVFSQHENLGKQVKALVLCPLTYSTNLSQNISELFSHTPNLHRIIANRLGCGGFYNPTGATDIFDCTSLAALGHKAGASLLELEIHLRRPLQVQSPDMFYSFRTLRWLDYSSPARFEFDPSEVKKSALPNLEMITTSSINNTFLLFLSCLNLPKIRCAYFRILDRCDGAITFLRKHGSKLHTLELPFLAGFSVFDVCSRLEEFIVPTGKPGYGVAEFFYSNDEHPLKVIRIRTNEFLKGAEKEKFKYLGGLDLSNFTSLEEIQVAGCVWPVTEREIKRNHWVAWTERLQELYQVDIVNEKGQRWVRRLQERR